MNTGTLILIIVLVVVLIVIAALWSTYNGLVKLDERVNEAWSDITVQLKYRADLIPNVVETVKGYAKHEKEVFEGVTQARSAVMGAKTVKAAAEAEATMTSALSRVFAIAEAYPQLKADSNFLKLQEQLQDVEDKIQASRRFYNAGAKELNTKIKTFPTNVINKLIGHFKTRDYFEVAETERAKIAEAPEVKF
ncbi:MAG: LemA family protein [Bacteroidaceae bacterium]|nr:LemA family protein [Bacteroidaceae bacterium]MBR3594901.1 LemA family protein [Candidatus Saccharibacteria bacterium]MBR6122186.1 LemA family protein [Candidatus Saccharibacteria bacterium]